MQIAPVPRISIQAFCETQASATAINRAAMDRRMSKTHLKVNMGGASAAMEAYRNSPTPNLVVLEGNGDRALLLSQLEELSEFCDPGTKVIIIGPSNDIELYRELIALGVSDYMHAPVEVIAFVASVSKTFVATKGKSLGKVTAVLGAKGGVGASTIAHTVAWGLSTQ
jgi:pilus assembly protein CpaE